MDEKENLSLSTPIEDLEKRIFEEKDIDELNNVIDLFNLNIKKKEIVRNSKLSLLQDKIFNQMSERLDKHAGEFSNKDLLDYFKVINETVNSADNTLDDVKTPQIQFNQQVNINTSTEDSLNRESREKVNNIINQILSQESLNSLDESEEENNIESEENA